MAGTGVFLCYRRDDVPGEAGRLFDRLSAHFSEGQVFRDLDSIAVGEDFHEHIERAVAASAVVVAVIGPTWLAPGSDGRSRLFRPDDYVRLELRMAFEARRKVVPVYMRDAVPPQPDDVPHDVRPLTRLQGLDVSDRRWRYDTAQLIDVLEGVLSASRPQPSPASPASRVPAPSEDELRSRRTRAYREGRDANETAIVCAGLAPEVEGWLEQVAGQVGARLDRAAPPRGQPARDPDQDRRRAGPRRGVAPRAARHDRPRPHRAAHRVGRRAATSSAPVAAGTGGRTRGRG